MRGGPTTERWLCHAQFWRLQQIYGNRIGIEGVSSSSRGKESGGCW